MSNSGACLNSGEFSGEFPTFRLLVVDDEIHYLKILEQMLKKCQYEVTTCDRGEDALSLLRANKNNFHLVILDVHMPDMDGVELLKQITREMNLPVIMMSADDSRGLVLKCVVHGARDYLIKPVRIESLQNIWQHIVRHNKDEWKCKISDQYTGNVEQVKEVEYSRVTNEGRLKKARTVWSPELRRKFVQAVNLLGIDRAVPTKILELMNVPGLKREHVASYLQKHRLLLRKHQNGLNNAFMGHSEANIETLSNHRPATKSLIYVPLPEQINHYYFENPMTRYQNQLQMNECNKKVNLVYEIPTTVEQNPSFLGMNIPVGRISQNMLSQSNNVLPQNGIIHSVPQASSPVDFSLSAMSASNEDVNYIFDELYQQNVGSTFDTSYHSSIHHGVLSMEQSEQNVNAPIAEAVLSNGLHVNAERYLGSSYESTIFTETFDQEDLRNVFLEQQQQ